MTCWLGALRHRALTFDEDLTGFEQTQDFLAGLGVLEQVPPFALVPDPHRILPILRQPARIQDKVGVQ
jgi:hypothetical protein